MANFSASLRDPLTGLVDITVTGTTLSIDDNSNYFINTEWGHAQADFTLYRRLDVLNPDGTTITYLSTTGAIVAAAGQALPITNTHTYLFGDSVYRVTLATVPTWQAGGGANQWDVNDCVYYSGLLYKCIVVATTELPTDTAHWTAIAYTSLTSKYLTSEYVTCDCETHECNADAVVAAVDAIACGSCGCLCDSTEVYKAIKTGLILDSIQPLTNISAWAKIQENINLAKQLCCC
jgi:hypothetical protein